MLSLYIWSNDSMAFFTFFSDSAPLEATYLDGSDGAGARLLWRRAY